MPIDFELRFAVAGSVAHPHPWGNPFQIPRQGGLIELPSLMAASSDNDIAVSPVFVDSATRYFQDLPELWPIDLHTALGDLCQNERGVRPIRNLGVLFASKYAPRPEVLGVMFDTGFEDEDEPSEIPSDTRTVPREGCAVFVNRIHDLKGSDVAEFDAQICFTLMHELGHVFNLHHTAGEGCFLDTSDSGPNAPPRAHFKYLPRHRDRLEQCSHNSSVTPGEDLFGSQEYFENPIRNGRFVAPDYNHHLVLEAIPTLRSFYRWEPVELEIKLKLSPKSRRKSIQVPDTMDPGYRSFVIWIEDPSGERRRYRPTKHYCWGGKTITIAPRKAFRRDISIFGGSGGLTFRTPGYHRIWAAFQLEDGSVVRSEPVAIEILPDLHGTGRTRAKLQEMRKLFRVVSKQIFYRSGAFSKDRKEALKELREKGKGRHMGGACAYALGRWLEHQATRHPQDRKDWYRLAIPHLKAAADCDLINSNRRDHARAILRAIDPPKGNYKGTRK